MTIYDFILTFRIILDLIKIYFQITITFKYVHSESVLILILKYNVFLGYVITEFIMKNSYKQIIYISVDINKGFCKEKIISQNILKVTPIPKNEFKRKLVFLSFLFSNINRLINSSK